MQTAQSTYTSAASSRAYGQNVGYWPLGLLEAFTLRMSSHGHCVSSNMMMGDPGYAVQQLAHAHSLSDEGLRDLAMALFHHFERHQSGLPYQR